MSNLNFVTLSINSNGIVWFLKFYIMQSLKYSQLKIKKTKQKKKPPMLSLFPPNPDIVKPKKYRSLICLFNGHGKHYSIHFVEYAPGFWGNRVWIMMRFNTVHRRTNANLNSNAKLYNLFCWICPRRRRRCFTVVEHIQRVQCQKAGWCEFTKMNFFFSRYIVSL